MSKPRNSGLLFAIGGAVCYVYMSGSKLFCEFFMAATRFYRPNAPLPRPAGRPMAFVAACLAVMFAAAAGNATLVEIDYLDRNGTGGFPDNGGPHWTGVVDTVSNTLTINTWIDLPGTPEFWTPNLTALPLVWPAVKSNGSPYDVPDNWTGHIDASFGFVSPTSVRNMQWNEGVWGQAPGFSLPPDADLYPGWGGVRKPVNVNGVTQLMYDTSADETSMPLLPISSLGLAISDRATVTATILANVEAEAVPETSAFLFAGLIAVGALLAAKFHGRVLKPVA
jgi:hypothetical protein